MIGIVAAAAVAGVLIQSGRSSTGSVARPAHRLGPGGSEILGSVSAPVLVEEYGDFQCPACGSWDRAVFPTIERMVGEGRIRFAYYPFAFIGPESYRAANAAICAGDEGRFWEYRTWLYRHQGPENSGALTGTALVKVGRDMGLTSARFERCVVDGRYDEWVRRVGDGAVRRGVTATPTIFVAGRQVTNLSLEAFRAAVQTAERSA